MGDLLTAAKETAATGLSATVDFALVERLDASCMQVLVALERDLKARGVPLRLWHVPAAVDTYLRLAGAEGLLRAIGEPPADADPAAGAPNPVVAGVSEGGAHVAPELDSNEIAGVAPVSELVGQCDEAPAGNEELATETLEAPVEAQPVEAPMPLEAPAEVQVPVEAQPPPEALVEAQAPVEAQPLEGAAPPEAEARGDQPQEPTQALPEGPRVGPESERLAEAPVAWSQGEPARSHPPELLASEEPSDEPAAATIKGGMAVECGFRAEPGALGSSAPGVGSHPPDEQFSEENELGAKALPPLQQSASSSEDDATPDPPGLGQVAEGAATSGDERAVVAGEAGATLSGEDASLPGAEMTDASAGGALQVADEPVATDAEEAEEDYRPMTARKGRRNRLLK